MGWFSSRKQRRVRILADGMIEITGYSQRDVYVLLRTLDEAHLQTQATPEPQEGSMTNAEEHVDDLIEIQQGEYRDACCGNSIAEVANTAYADAVVRLVDACDQLDQDAHTTPAGEGTMGTSVIRHILNGGTLETWDQDHA